MRVFFFFSQVTSKPAQEPGCSVSSPPPASSAIRDFVQAEVKSQYRNVHFFAKFLDVDKASEDLKLHCLSVKPGSADIFVWGDESWLPKEQITKIVGAPVPPSGICLVLLLFLSSFFY